MFAITKAATIIRKWIALKGPYKPPVRCATQFLKTPMLYCVYFIHKKRGMQFKVDSERQIFEKTISGNFLFTLSFETVTEEIFFLYFILLNMSDLRFEPLPCVQYAQTLPTRLQ